MGRQQDNSPGAFAADWKQLGPQGDWRSERWPVARARAYCRRLATTHYENFSVASWLLPARLRPHFYNIYAWCRWADDLADETANLGGGALALLDWWEDELAACFQGDPRHPVLIALAETIREFDLPREPFRDLLSAFRQDQVQDRYETFAELLDYCRRSANPVGDLILRLARRRDAETAPLSDAICTGLQLANFWQDVAGDYERGRIYLPRETRERFGCDEAFARREATPAFREALAWEVARAEEFLKRGLPLARLAPPLLKFDIELFAGGGLAILAAIRRQRYDVWSRRPTVGGWAKLRLFGRAAVSRVFAGGG